MSRPVPLPAIEAADSATEFLPDFAEAGLADYVDMAVEAPSWPHRWLAISAFWLAPHDSEFEVEATTRMLTAVGEQLGERSIDCVRAAAFYRVSMHAAWRQAAMRWLNTADADELQAFLDLNPEFVRFLVQHASVYDAEESVG